MDQISTCKASPLIIIILMSRRGIIKKITLVKLLATHTHTHTSYPVPQPTLICVKN